MGIRPRQVLAPVLMNILYKGGNNFTGENEIFLMHVWRLACLIFKYVKTYTFHPSYVLSCVYSPIHKIPAVTSRRKQASCWPGHPGCQDYFRFYWLDMISEWFVCFKKSFGKWLLTKLFQLSCFNTSQGEVLTTTEITK